MRILIASSLALVCSLAAADAVRAGGGLPDDSPGDATTLEAVEQGRSLLPPPDANGEARGTLSRIAQIAVVGNTWTSDETVLWIARIAEGARFHPQMRSRIIKDLNASGLFASVDLDWEVRPGGYLVTVMARDRRSYGLAPRYINQPTNKGIALEFVESDLFGDGAKLEVLGQLATGESILRGAFIDQEIADTAFGWRVDTQLRRERVIEYQPPREHTDLGEEFRRTRVGSLHVGGALTRDLTERWSASAGMRIGAVWFSDTELPRGVDAPADIPAPGGSGYEFVGRVELEYERQARFYGVTHGDRYRLSLDYAPGLSFTDFAYLRSVFEMQLARQVWARHNAVFRVRLGYGGNLPFHREFTSGGPDLRGFKNLQYRGDAQAAAAVHYSVPLIAVRGVSVRALAFAESAYTAFFSAELDGNGPRDYLPGAGALGLAPWKNTVGLGVRLHVRQYDAPLLGVDLGYGIEQQGVEVYLTLGLGEG